MNMRSQPISIRNLLLLTVGALTLMIALLSMRAVYTEYHRMVKMNSLKKAMLLSDSLFDISGRVSVERDLAYTLLHAPDGEIRGILEPKLLKSRKETDEAIIEVVKDVRAYDLPEFNDLLRQVEDGVAGIREMRNRIDTELKEPLAQRKPELSEQWFDSTTNVIRQTQLLSMNFIMHFSDIDSAVVLHVRFKHLLGVIMEYSGRERSLIGRLIVQKAQPDSRELMKLIQWQATVEFAWNDAETLAAQGALYSRIELYFKDAKSHYYTLYDMVRDIFYLPGVHNGGKYPISVDFWLELANDATDSLYALKDAALKESRNYTDALEARIWQSIAANVLLLALASALCLYSFYIINRRVIAPINSMISALLLAIEGKPLPPLPSASLQQDEIGKLLQVLHAFQQKMQDIKRYSRELEHYTRELERSNKELDDFSYIASHDLKEPLRGIHNHSRFLLEDNEGRLDEGSVKRIGRLIYLSQRMERLVNDLLYFSRLGRLDLAIQSTDMNEVIEDVENTLDLFLAERNASIVLPEPLPSVVCDKVRVTEVFRNLITNGVKYNDKDVKTIEIGFRPTVTTREGVVRQNVFYVKDNGKGIAPEFYNDVFRIFKRLQAGEEKPEEGTGVGLTFVKKIIDRHNGKIWLESTPGIGTTFYFTLGES